MKATRVIPGRPEASGTHVAATIIDLVASTLAKRPSVDSEAVRVELRPAASLFSMLANGGHLRDEALVLVAGTLRMVIDVPVGEAALGAEVDIRVPTGSATATTWPLHLPSPDQLGPAVDAVVKSATHLSVKAAPAEAPTATASAVTVDLSRLGTSG